MDAVRPPLCKSVVIDPVPPAFEGFSEPVRARGVPLTATTLPSGDELRNDAQGRNSPATLAWELSSLSRKALSL